MATVKTGVDRDEFEAMWQAWIDVNKHAQDIGDWTPLARYYAPDATYGWMYQPDEHFMAVGREEIREWALGFEMLGFDGWSYPYVGAVLDHVNGTAVGFWKQISTMTDPAGKPYEVVGIGGSWFGYAGDMQWAWQRDFFDMASVSQTIMRVITDGNVTPAMQRRFEMVAAGMPGHYAFADLPAPLWPVA
jgi:hypothetical protein